MSISAPATQLPPWWPKAAAVAGAAAASLVVLRALRDAEPRAGGGRRDPGGRRPRRAGPRSLGRSGRWRPGPWRPPSARSRRGLDARAPAAAVEKAGELGKYLAFKKEYQTTFMARPDVGEGQLLKVTDWYRLTPEDYDRTTFHIEVDVSGTSIEKLVNGADGKALSVYATNDSKGVAEFITAMGLDPNQVVSAEEIRPPEEEGTVVLTTVEKLLTQYLDLFGKPTREFLKKLVPFAHDILEKVKIAELTLERKTEDFQDRQARAYTFADYLTEFKSLGVPVEKYVELIPTIKQRVYSICSSSDYRPGKCQLLVVREDWEANGGVTKFGLCSSFLTFLRRGQFCVGHSTHSVMKIPEDRSAHIFMAGLGTGLAPFRAFVEQRKFQQRQGHRVGPMTLFFGGRYSKTEYNTCTAHTQHNVQQMGARGRSLVLTLETLSVIHRLGGESRQGWVRPATQRARRIPRSLSWTGGFPQYPSGLRGGCAGPPGRLPGELYCPSGRVAFNGSGSRSST